MVNHLYHEQRSHLWTADDSGECEGVLLRQTRGQYLTCPPELADSTLATACAELNVQVALTVKSELIRTYFAWTPNAKQVPLSNGRHIQALCDMSDLGKARKNQFAAFLFAEALLVVWDDDPRSVIQRARNIECDLIQLVRQTGQPNSGVGCIGKRLLPHEKKLDSDPESGSFHPKERPTNLMNSILVGYTLGLVVLLLGLGGRAIAIEIAVDGNYLRLAFLLLTPIQIFFTLFFGQVLVNCVAQCIGPVRQMQLNSKYFSAKPSHRLLTHPLPHMTIQCPVYKEGLSSVIMPTVQSIKQAMSTYELQGGSANLLINDDGLQIIPDVDRQARLNFYLDNNVGWTARPGHNTEGFIRRGKFKKASNMNYGLMLSCAVEDKLLRRSRSKDWTQMSEDLAYQTYLAETLTEHPRAWAAGDIRIGDYILLIDSDTRVPSDCLLDAASEMAQSPEVGILQFSSGVMQVTHTYFENAITFFTNLIYTAITYTVANGDVAPFVGHNAILRWSAIQQVSYTDDDNQNKFWSESHVSEDFDMSLRLQCAGYIIRLATWAGDGFKEGVSLTVYDELARWEKYAYGCNELLFHPLRSWWRKGPFTPLFTHFLLTPCIRLTSKLTILSYIGTYYAIGAAWPMTLANYFAVGWFNGHLDHYYMDSWRVWISLVVVFNVVGNVAVAVMRYRGRNNNTSNDTSGREQSKHDKSMKSFTNSHKTGSNHTKKTIHQNSINNKILPTSTSSPPPKSIPPPSLLTLLGQNMKYTLPLTIFLGGLSLHISQALLSHFFSLDMSWGATGKESNDTNTNFPTEMRKIANKFRWSICLSLAVVLVMIILAGPVGTVGEAGAPLDLYGSGSMVGDSNWVVPHEWRVREFVAIFPLAMVVAGHLLVPFVLNPGLMRWRW